jgi:hypothetical protein
MVRSGGRPERAMTILVSIGRWKIMSGSVSWRVKLNSLVIADGVSETVARNLAADLIVQASARAYATPGAWTAKAADLEKAIRDRSVQFGKVGQWWVSVETADQ